MASTVTVVVIAVTAPVIMRHVSFTDVTRTGELIRIHRDS